jgi:hypothetical protein
MSFELKNVGATYQRCIQFCFKGQIGCNLEVYVDDVIIKSRRSSNLIANLKETFNNLRLFNIKMDTKKCTFEVPWGKLLGYIITEQGIEENLNKISIIVEIGQVRNVKDVQRLMGCLVALLHFMSQLGERKLLLYKLLKKSDSFRWMDET